jgi:hypothetical protein
VIVYDATEGMYLTFAHVNNVIASVNIIITSMIFAIAVVGSRILFTFFVIACVKDMIASQIFTGAGVFFELQM